MGKISPAVQKRQSVWDSGGHYSDPFDSYPVEEWQEQQQEQQQWQQQTQLQQQQQQAASQPYQQLVTGYAMDPYAILALLGFLVFLFYIIYSFLTNTGNGGRSISSDYLSEQ